MTKRIYKPMLGYPSMTAYQEAQLRLLEQCAERHKKETGKVACVGCLKLDSCYQTWGMKCGTGFHSGLEDLC